MSKSQQIVHFFNWSKNIIIDTLSHTVWHHLTEKMFVKVVSGPKPSKLIQSVPGIVIFINLKAMAKLWMKNFFCIIYKTLYLTLGHHALARILCLCLNFFWVINSWIVLTKSKKPKKFAVQYFWIWRSRSLAHPVVDLLAEFFSNLILQIQSNLCTTTTLVTQTCGRW